MRGNSIIVSANPQGKFLEGTIVGTPKPGTMMQLRNASWTNGRPSYEPYAPGVGDGAPRELIVLLTDELQGKTLSDAYVTGTRGFLYCPIPGEELNVRKADISGTGSATEDLDIGERLLIVDGTGMVSPVAVGIIASPATYPFKSLEAITDQPAETLVHVQVQSY